MSILSDVDTSARWIPILL